MGASRRADTILVAATALFASLTPSAYAASWDEVDFKGAGWGHGVGLSQYGALAMATTGSNYQQILAHYYQGTSLGTVAPTTSLWVNLERDFSSKTLTVVNTGPSQGSDVTITGEAGQLTAKSGATIQLTLTGSDGCTVQVTNPSETPASLADPSNCVFDMTWYDWSNPAVDPTTALQVSGCTLADWNTPGGTVFRPCTYAHGTLHLRYGPGGLDLSSEMLMDDYVLGISEMPYPWNVEALKSQAVAARSYAEGRRLVRGNPASNSCSAWCHVKDTTSDQRYVGWGHSQTANWVAATEGTALQVLTHPDSNLAGDVITAYYSSSTGGATEYGHVVGYSSGPVEWLSSVDDSWAIDGTVYNPNASWTYTYDADYVAAQVGLDYLTHVMVTETRPGSGSAETLEYWGIKDGVVTSVEKTGTWTDITFGLKSLYFSVDFRLPGEEMFFYRADGTFRYDDVNPDGSLGPPILTGSGYTANWKAITSIDLDGDGQDEIFFYREDGLFRYYEISPDGHVGAPILAGSGYTVGWDSVTAIDLDGDGQDEIFFYREDGLFRFYDINPNGTLGSPILAGSGYTAGWDSITAVDLDGDGQDEMFFYREDGLFRYYNVKSNGAIGSPLLAGNGYTTGWSAITAVDINGDDHDEMFFYRVDGLYRYYPVDSVGNLGSPIKAGDTYFHNWSNVTSIDLDGY